MIHHTRRNALLIGCVLIALTNFVHAETFQCMNEAGRRTYTDVPCSTESEVVAMPVLPQPMIITIRNRSPENMIAPSSKKRGAKLDAKKKAARTFALDVATLKEAKAAMLIADEASSLSRQKKVVLALNQKETRWFNN